MIRLLLIGVAFSLAGCQTVETTKAGAVGVDREQRMAVSAEDVSASSVKQYAQMMAEAKKKGVLDRDAAQVQRVQAITKRLVAQASAFRTDTAKWPWEVHVISLAEVKIGRASCRERGE